MSDIACVLILSVIVAVVLLFGCASPALASVESDMQAASGLQQWESELKEFEGRLTGEQAAMWGKLSAADKQVVMANNMQRLAESDKAAQQGRVDAARQEAANAEYETKKARDMNAWLMASVVEQPEPQQTQTAKSYGYANTPQQTAQVLTDTETSKEWFVSGEGTFRPASKTVNTYIVQPSPVVVAKQSTKINTVVNGIDRIETKAVLPEMLTVEQLDAVQKIADNGTLIAQQRFGLEQYKINLERDLEVLRIVKSFVLWGLIVSIPFIGVGYFIARSALKGAQSMRQESLEYKLKELQAAENAVYDHVKK